VKLQLDFFDAEERRGFHRGRRGDWRMGAI